MKYGKILSLLMLAAIVGCGKSKTNQLPVYPVSGVVTLNGVPLPGANVILIPVESVNGDQRTKQPYACGGMTDDDGEFVLTTYQPNDGAPEGDYVVTISCENREKQVSRGTYAELLPHRYQSPAESQLTATVSKGKNELPPFELIDEKR